MTILIMLVVGMVAFAAGWVVCVMQVPRMLANLTDEQRADMADRVYKVRQRR